MCATLHHLQEQLGGYILDALRALLDLVLGDLAGEAEKDFVSEMSVASGILDEIIEEAGADVVARSQVIGGAGSQSLDVILRAAELVDIGRKLGFKALVTSQLLLS